MILGQYHRHIASDDDEYNYKDNFDDQFESNDKLNQI